MTKKKMPPAKPVTRWQYLVILTGILGSLGLATLVYFGALAVQSQGNELPVHSKLAPVISLPAVAGSTSTPGPPYTRQATYSVPILMFHYVRPLPGSEDSLGEALSVDPQTFSRDLDYLEAKGYTTVSFSQLKTGFLPPKPIIVTLDDGYADAYTIALPALQAHHMVATFYIVSDFVDHPGSVSWKQLREMRDAGMEIGAHTINHADLAILPVDEQQRQIQGSIKDISKHLKRNVTSFAYPSGKYNAETLKLSEQAGIVYAVTTQPGISNNASDPLQLPRVRIENNTDLDMALLPH